MRSSGGPECCDQNRASRAQSGFHGYLRAVPARIGFSKHWKASRHRPSLLVSTARVAAIRQGSICPAAGLSPTGASSGRHAKDGEKQECWQDNPSFHRRGSRRSAGTLNGSALREPRPRRPGGKGSMLAAATVQSSRGAGRMARSGRGPAHVCQTPELHLIFKLRTLPRYPPTVKAKRQNPLSKDDGRQPRFCLAWRLA
jgi:hypothetical protein